jgi:hypothetical protein
MTEVSKELTYDDEGCLVLKGELFWKWKAVHESVQRCDAEIKLRTPMIDALLETMPELKKLLGERAMFIQQSMTMRGEYKNVLATLEEHFGFPMTNVSIDDLTGRVHRLEPEAPAPSPSVKNGVNKKTKTPKASKPTPKKRK